MLNKKLSLFLIILLVFSFAIYLVTPVVVLARESKDTESKDTEKSSYGDRIKIPNPLNPDEAKKPELITPTAQSIDRVDIADLSARIARGLMAPIGGLAFIFFVIGGFYWIFSAGNEERIKKGREIMMWSIIGIVVVFSSYALLSFFFRTIGIAE